MRRSALIGLLVVTSAAVCAPAASASFDPPDGTVIHVNLPSTVPIAYAIDVGAICAGSVPARVTTFVRTPSGRRLRPLPPAEASGPHEASFGVELTAYGRYSHWIDVRCADGATRTVERGSFRVARGETATSRCATARTALRKARRQLAAARRALKRGETAKRVRAVRTARAQVRTAEKRKNTRCART